MSQIEVRRLHYRGEASRAGRVEHAVGDALRTETVDDGRLILVRSLRLGRIGFGERGASRATATAWRDLIGSARHGGSSGAESANCVWFASVAEARTLLLRELAGGRTPFAWFWALAVPDWRRMTLTQYVECRLAVALGEPSGEAMAALVDEAIAAGATDSLAAAILARMPAGTGSRLLPVERSPPEEQWILNAVAATSSNASAVSDVEREVALGVRKTVPSPLYAVLERLAARSEAVTLVQVLARGLVRRLHPALALTPRDLERVSFFVTQLLRFGETRSVRHPSISAEEEEVVHAPFTARAGEAPPNEGRRNEVIDEEPLPRPAEPAPDTIIPALPETEAPAALHPQERASGGAGIFLAIVPLLRMGWRRWLAEHPDLLLHQPGARLLHLTATHHRVPPTDAIWSVLPTFDMESEPPPVVIETLQLWRAGLNGWLRRKARLSLAELVLRRGWLLPGPDTTIIRFPLNEIDIRLRRLALDGDPGWVDWLGHAYRLVYRDRPLTEPQP